MEFLEGSRIGPYRVVRALGAGAMGSVWEVESPDGTRLALKTLHTVARADSGAMARFRREARVCASLEGPHVIRVADFGIDEATATPYLVMRLLCGETLEACVARIGPLRPVTAVAIALETAKALSFAHVRGVVHRDLKPSNIFLETSGEQLTAVVCDFGVAKVYDEDGSLTASGAVLGTPLYMAPEQLINSRLVDERADVWGLGMTLYHALAGRAAFEDKATFSELLIALTQHAVPNVQEAAPWVEAHLARVLHAALLAVDKRFPTIEAFASALTAALPEARGRALTRADVARVAESPPHEAMHATMPASYAELAELADSLVGRTVAGRYRVRRRIGEGGMGAVYEALDDADARVALKVMRDETKGNGDGVRRFFREARAARAIDSPFVTRIHDAGMDPALGAPFLVMELLAGSDLGAIVRRVGPLPPPVVASLFVQACEGLERAHALGIVHRDIKPANIFVHEPPDGRLQVKLCDFGIAKQLPTSDSAEGSTELTQTGGLLGSPLYMSPEQARNAKQVDARTDVYSLALSMHEALSGRRPWEGRTAMGELILAICTEELPSLTSIAPWIDPGLAGVVHRALARDVGERTATARDLRVALAPYALVAELRKTDLVVASTDARRSLRIDEARTKSDSGASKSLEAVARPSQARVPAPARSRAMRLASAGAVAAVVLAAAAGVWRETAIPGPVTRATASDATSTVVAPSTQTLVRSTVDSTDPPAPTAAAAPLATAMPTVRLAVTASASGSDAGARVAGRGARASAPRATPSGNAPTAIAPAAPATVGRGVTATELPP